MTDEAYYRFCVYCEADCYADEHAHAADCPSVTGLWPVRPEDLGPKCNHCGERAFGMSCLDCGAEMKVGDFYVHRTVGGGDPLLPGIEGAAVVVCVCVGCAAHGTLAGTGDG